MKDIGGDWLAGLHKRAAGWPLEKRIWKVAEECAELAAAVVRYSLNPSEARRLQMAEEMVGVMFTLANVEPELSDSMQAVLNRQVSRLEDALRRDGL